MKVVRKLKKIENTIVGIEEELLLKAMAELRSANESMENIEEKMKELETCLGIL